MTQQQQIASLDRTLQALELRKAGYGYDYIAEKLGYRGRQGAWAAVNRALKKVKGEPAQELIDIELHRLDSLWRPMYVRALRGDIKAIDRCLAIMRRRAELLGLDGAQALNITLNGQLGVKANVDITSHYNEDQIAEILAGMAEYGAFDEADLDDDNAEAEPVYTGDTDGEADNSA